MVKELRELISLLINCSYSWARGRLLARPRKANTFLDSRRDRIELFDIPRNIATM